MIELKNFRKEYGDFVAVENLNLKIAAGELFGFIGPNGAGKSTTIRFLATLLKATHGEGTVNGHSVTGDPIAVRRSVGYMPDNFGVYDGMKVWETFAPDGRTPYGNHFKNGFASATAATDGQRVYASFGPRGLMAVDMNGKLLDWNPAANGVVGAWDATAHPSGTNLTVGGSFTTFGGGTQEQKRLAVFD